jgi:hypothetical protein
MVLRERYIDGLNAQGSRGLAIPNRIRYKPLTQRSLRL